MMQREATHLHLVQSVGTEKMLRLGLDRTSEILIQYHGSTFKIVLVLMYYDIFEKFMLVTHYCRVYLHEGCFCFWASFPKDA